MNRWLGYAVLFMAAVLLFGGAFRPIAKSRTQRPQVGYQAPNFSLLDTGGNPVKLSDYRGKAILLNFWATWCPPCKAEMPEIQKLQQEMPDLVILGVDLGQTERSPEWVASYMEENGYTWQVPYDADGAVSGLYGVVSIPTSFFIDSSGVIRGKYVGPMSLPLLRDKALGAMAR